MLHAACSDRMYVYKEAEEVLRCVRVWKPTIWKVASSISLSVDLLDGKKIILLKIKPSEIKYVSFVRDPNKSHFMLSKYNAVSDRLQGTIENF